MLVVFMERSFVHPKQPLVMQRNKITGKIKTDLQNVLRWSSHFPNMELNRQLFISPYSLKVFCTSFYPDFSHFSKALYWKIMVQMSVDHAVFKYSLRQCITFLLLGFGYNSTAWSHDKVVLHNNCISEPWTITIEHYYYINVGGDNLMLAVILFLSCGFLTNRFYINTVNRECPTATSSQCKRAKRE